MATVSDISCHAAPSLPIGSWDQITNQCHHSPLTSHQAFSFLSFSLCSSFRVSHIFQKNTTKQNFWWRTFSSFSLDCLQETLLWLDILEWLMRYISIVTLLTLLPEITPCFPMFGKLIISHTFTKLHVYTHARSTLILSLFSGFSKKQEFARKEGRKGLLPILTCHDKHTRCLCLYI